MRYPRTIVFVDLSGFTAYIRRTDDDAAIAMLKASRNRIPKENCDTGACMKSCSSANAKISSSFRSTSRRVIPSSCALRNVLWYAESSS